MKSVIVAIVGTGLCAAAWAGSEQPLELKTDSQKINYSLGYQIGGDFKRQGIELDGQAVVRGIQDAISGKEPLMKPEEVRTTLMELRRKIIAAQQEKRKEEEQKKLADGKKYMDENAKKPGVVTTKSGLQYKVLKEGTGKSPSATDRVTVNYRGTTVDGKEFDSSYKRGKPATFRLNGVIKGWTEGLQLMKEGGKAELVIPPKLAYGSRGPLGDQTLIFDVELIAVGPKSQPAKTPAEKQQSAKPAAGKEQPAKAQESGEK
jgi:FKBP-type peptidyl-prolyl cis-trans isomerase FklB